LLHVSRLQRRPVARAAAALLACATLGITTSARGQTVPSTPLTLAGGRLTVGGDLSVTASCARPDAHVSEACPPDTGFFNFTDYDHSALRMIRVDVTAAFRANRRLSVLGEVRSENGGRPEPYALYVRFKPWSNHDVDLQAGRIPPTFGAFARRTYASDNILIGYPLAYQYLSSLRPDALPATADELLSMRGRGWLSSFSIGNPEPRHGMPMVSAFRWDTGVQLHAASRVVEVAVSATVGTLANPLVRDDNDGRQIAARAALHPITGLTVGVSGARGPFLTRQAARLAGVEHRDGSLRQTAWGGDVEYSWSYYLIRFEAVGSSWDVPLLGQAGEDTTLRALATSLEARYKIHPRVYLAGRLDHLGFSAIAGASGRGSWDAPVDRLEIGGSYALQRNLQLRVAFQRNTRPAGRATRVHFAATQLVYWF
jgi:hypothetical protein